MKIGVFDSGVGGQAVAQSIQAALPKATVLCKEDKENLPYGTKTPEELKALVVPILQSMVKDGCEVIVIACNTVTTTIISDLRKIIRVPLVGIEPMIKPASQQTKSKIIAVCATPITLSSVRYKQLAREYSQGISILEPDCSQWAFMIENDLVDHAIIRQQINDVCEQGADVIVLGCTHYHWIEKDIKQVADKYGCYVMQPEQAVIEELKRVIEQLD